MLVRVWTVVTVLLACVLLSESARTDRTRSRSGRRKQRPDFKFRDKQRHRVEKESIMPVQAPHNSSSISVERQKLNSTLSTETNATTIADPNLPFRHRQQDDLQVGCTELRSKRYISDGFCTSLKPVTEVICTGHCLPIRDLPWYAEFIKVWSHSKIMEYRCVNDEVKRRRVHLSCENGETRTYKIKVVRSCKCKKYTRLQNESLGTWSTTDVKDGDNQKRRRRKNKKSNDSDPPTEL